MKFTGTTYGKLDAKGRVFFPANFRKKLAEGEEEFVLRKDIYQPCLVIYPLKVWEDEVDLLRLRLNRWNAHEAMVLRQFMADAEYVQLDAAGRLLLSKRLLQFAQIDKELVFLGLDDRIEIWNKASLDQPFLSTEEFGIALDKLMSNEPDF